jgi:excisionase family DNA binding protein
MNIELLSVDEVADILRVSRHRVYQLAREGRMGGTIRMGRQLRFDRGRLSDWLKTGGEALPGGWRRETLTDIETGDCSEGASKRRSQSEGATA